MHTYEGECWTNAARVTARRIGIYNIIIKQSCIIQIHYYYYYYTSAYRFRSTFHVYAYPHRGLAATSVVLYIIIRIINAQRCIAVSRPVCACIVAIIIVHCDSTRGDVELFHPRCAMILQYMYTVSTNRVGQ